MPAMAQPLLRKLSHGAGIIMPVVFRRLRIKQHVLLDARHKVGNFGKYRRILLGMGYDAPH